MRKIVYLAVLAPLEWVRLDVDCTATGIQLNHFTENKQICMLSNIRETETVHWIVLYHTGTRIHNVVYTVFVFTHKSNTHAVDRKRKIISSIPFHSISVLFLLLVQSLRLRCYYLFNYYYENTFFSCYSGSALFFFPNLCISNFPSRKYSFFHYVVEAKLYLWYDYCTGNSFVYYCDGVLLLKYAATIGNYFIDK